MSAGPGGPGGPAGSAGLAGPGGPGGDPARRRRALSIVLSLVVLAGVAVLVLGGGGGGDGGGGRSATTIDPADLQAVTGLVGSEKEAFFADPDVQAAFARHGLAVEVDGSGSRQIARSTRLDDTELDFAFPSSAPAARTVEQHARARGTYAPFHSPMAIASFRSVVDVLARPELGVVTEAGDGTWAFDVAAFLRLADRDVTWQDLDPDGFAARRNVLVRTTDPRTSNSAAMYLALTSHVANGGVVTTEAQRVAVMDRVASLFLEQGYGASTSATPFDEYLSQGVGNAPLLFVYEAQFLERALAGDGSIVSGGDDPNREMVLLYPSPTILSTHTVVALTPEGDEVGRLLSEDPDLQELAARYGYRTKRPEVFREVVAGVDGVAVRGDVVDVVDPPSWDMSEAMLVDLDERYGSPAPEPVDGSGAG